MNGMLLYLEFSDTFWSFRHALKFIHKRASLPPLGLLTVAAMLPDGWAKRLVDVDVRKLREPDLAWADVAFGSGMIARLDSAQKLIARCRAASKTVVAGEPLLLTEYEQFPEVAHLVLNEAGVTLPEFLRAFGRHMQTADVFKLLCNPFGRLVRTREPDLPARILEAGLEEPVRQKVSATNWSQRLIASKRVNLRSASSSGDGIPAA